MEPGAEKLFSHIARFVQLKYSEQELVAAAVRHRVIKKRQPVLTPSQVCGSSWFVLSGSLRLFVKTKEDNDQILQFGLPDWWISDFQSLETGKVSGYSIDAVDEALVLVLDKKDRDKLFDQVPRFESYFRILMQRGYAAGVKRMEYFLTGSREELYLQFSRNYPDFVQTVPQYMLASFLGMTPEFLSKVRGKRLS